MQGAGAMWMFWFLTVGFLRASQGSEGQKLRALERELSEFLRAEFPEFSESSGLSENDGRVESFTFQAFDRRRDLNEQLLRQLEKIDRSRLSKDELTDWKILHHHVQTFLKGYEFREWGNLNPISFFDAPLKHRDWISKKIKSDPEKYLLRLQAIPQQIEEQISLMRKAISLNRTNHIISMNGTLEIIVADILFVIQNQSRKFHNLSGTEETWSTSTNSVVNSLRALIDFLDSEYFPATRSEIGLHSMPGGLAYYQACLDYHLGTRLTPAEIHSVGHREVNRLERLMNEIMQQYGFTGKISEFLQFIQSKDLDKKWNVYQVYRDVIDDARDSLGKVFHNISLTPLRFNTFNNSGTPTRGYYTNNVFHLNLFYENSTNVLPLAFHETYPGHHFQNCYKQQQKLPLYRVHPLYRRRFAIPFTYPTYTAYSEGWALYAEHLGTELGFYNTPLRLFQKYMSEMFRACRLVVDTGIHAFGWTKEKAIEFMSNYNNAPTSYIARQIDRYITLPGRACAYKIGEMKIRELRKRAEAKLGDKFDVKDFHDQILRIGPVGLDTLEEIVDDWITSLLPPLVANPIQSFNSSSVATNINSNHVINVFISLCITGYMLLC
uniref:Uncharacterized protein LOC111099994 n=1 Tax=Crassostrea virginica TaxID=6565 RepID=A0A8B8ABG4_CRAVI|nr:uncharacterized protein LOC111099994 [Crassostrea virginica]